MNRYENAVEASVMPRYISLSDNLLAIVFETMKLLPAKHIIDAAIKNGEIDENTTVIETSSGTFAYGMALVCNMYGLRSHIISDPAIDDTLKRKLEWLGATVEIVREPAPYGGYQAARLNLLHERMRDGKYYWTKQYENPSNMRAYYNVGKQAHEAVGGIDAIVGSIGSGGSLCGILAPLRERSPKVKGIAVDTNGSVLFGQQDKPRLLRGMGNSIHPENLHHEMVDEVHWVTPQQAYYYTKRLFCDKNLFMGPTSGAAYAVASWYAKSNPQETVAVIFADQGYRYQDDVYNDDWLSKHGMDGWNPNESPLTVTSPPQDGNCWARMMWNRQTFKTRPVSA